MAGISLVLRLGACSKYGINRRMAPRRPPDGAADPVAGRPPARVPGTVRRGIGIVAGEA